MQAKNKCIAAIVLGLFMLPTVGIGAPGNEEIKMKLAGYLTPTHLLAEYFEQYFMDAASKLTEGKVTFEYYPAGQLGKPSDFISRLNLGVVDVAVVSPAYIPEELPMSSVGELPNMFQRSCVGSWTLYKLTQPGGYLYEHELKKHNLRILSAFITPPYEVMTAGTPIKSLRAVKGMKLKTAGGAAADTARAIGAVPVQLTAAEVYTALSRGTVAGRFGVYQYMPDVKSVELLDYGTEGANVAAFSATIAMSLDKWEKLPPNVKRALTKAGRETVKHACATAHKKEAQIRDILIDEYGWEVNHLSKEGKSKWDEAMRPVRDEWAEDINERYGDQSGSKAVQAFLQTVQEVRKNHEMQE